MSDVIRWLCSREICQAVWRLLLPSSFVPRRTFELEMRKHFRMDTIAVVIVRHRDIEKSRAELLDRAKRDEAPTRDMAVKIPSSRLTLKAPPGCLIQAVAPTLPAMCTAASDN